MNTYKGILTEIQRMLNPELVRLEEGVKNLGKGLSDVGVSVNDLRKDHQRLAEALAKLEGKYQRTEETVINKIENQLLKRQLENEGNQRKQLE